MQKPEVKQNVIRYCHGKSWHGHGTNGSYTAKCAMVWTAIIALTGMPGHSHGIPRYDLLCLEIPRRSRHACHGKAHGTPAALTSITMPHYGTSPSLPLTPTVHSAACCDNP